MSEAVEWIFEIILWLPFGWRVVQTKARYRHLGYRRFCLWQKTKVPAPNIRGEMTSWGYRERYWPADIFKTPNPSEEK